MSGDSPESNERTQGWLAAIGWASLSALLTLLAYPPLPAWPLVALAPLPLAWIALRAPSKRRLIVVVFVTQLPLWLWFVRWSFPVTVAGYPLFAGYLALFTVLTTLLVRRLARDPRFARLPMTLLLPIVWIAMEVLRGNFSLGGFPFFLVGHPIVEMPRLAQSADLFGVYFVSFLFVMIAGLLTDVLRERGTSGSTRRLAILAAGVVVVHLANVSYGTWRLRQTAPLRDGPTVLALQTNLPQSNKMGWSIEDQDRDLSRFVAETESLVSEARAAGHPIDLVVWPETMVPGGGLDPDAEMWAGPVPDTMGRQFRDRVIDLQRRLVTPMLVGSPCYIGLVRDDAGGVTWQEHYNAAYLLDGGMIAGRYDKCMLTPFGETMPLVWRFPALERLLLSIGASGMRFELDAGHDYAPMVLNPGGPGEPVRVGAPICFEASVSWVSRRMIYDGGRKRGHLLLNLSNDGWFGEDDGARERMVQMTRIRCIENRVPLIRAVNTGLSVAMDSRGFVVATIGSGRYGEGRRSGAVRASVRLDDRATLFGRLGDSWGYACLVLTTIGLLLTVRRARP